MHALRCAGFWGGSADLAPSNMTLMKQFGDFQKDTPQERNLRYGVREHGMGAIANGITLHSPGFITYCATFFIFTGVCTTASSALLSGRFRTRTAYTVRALPGESIIRASLPC